MRGSCTFNEPWCLLNWSVDFWSTYGNREGLCERTVFSLDIFQQIFCLHVSFRCLLVHPPMIKDEGNSDLQPHRCPVSGLTNPMQSVLCMMSQGPGVNWVCNLSFDLIKHLVEGATDTVGQTLGHNIPDGRADVIPSQTDEDQNWGCEVTLIADLAPKSPNQMHLKTRKLRCFMEENKLAFTTVTVLQTHWFH